ncbi:hypothetical protein EDM21_12750 [Paenibacillus sp. N10]|uniref:HNH domain-containing protein n=1 Tax=Paenibacillus lutrae TaxID=2078573 RepID=A0A7X3JZT7_9BACL|nr:hypothetical protein [Paenibacillus lutrae]MVP00382.1 hypothetical protein [Paenibacillus lutrae]
MNLANQPVRDYSKEKQIKSRRIKPTQRQMGEISPKVDRELKERSQDICEVQKRCNGARAIERAHITGRKQLSHRTRAVDLLHACKPCHTWMDESVEGIRFRKALREQTK